MNHTQIKERLNAYLDKCLPQAEAGEVSRHVKECRACGREVTEWMKIKDAFLQAPEVKPSESFVWQVMEKIELKKAFSFDLLSFIRWSIPTFSLMIIALFLISVWPVNHDEAIAQELSVLQLDTNGDWLEVEL